MADEKTRYWLKIDKDFLKSPHIKVIKAMPNGKDYVLFYLSLMLESVENVGHLKFTDLIPYSEEMLASLTDTNIDIVRSAVQIFESLGLMQLLDDGTIFMTQVAEMTGKRSDSADRVKAFRERQKSKALHVTKCNDNIQSTEYKEESTEYREESRDREGDGKAAPSPKTDYDFYKATYNATCTSLPKCKLMTDKRRKAIKAFEKQLGKDQFLEVCEKASTSAFCTGSNDRGWKADFDFLIRADKAASILEGKYDSKEAHNGSTSESTSESTGATPKKKWNIESALDD